MLLIWVLLFIIVIIGVIHLKSYLVVSNEEQQPDELEQLNKEHLQVKEVSKQKQSSEQDQEKEQKKKKKKKRSGKKSNTQVQEEPSKQEEQVGLDTKVEKEQPIEVSDEEGWEKVQKRRPKKNK